MRLCSVTFLCIGQYVYNHLILFKITAAQEEDKAIELDFSSGPFPQLLFFFLSLSLFICGVNPAIPICDVHHVQPRA
jgi:hypothetical protein